MRYLSTQEKACKEDSSVSQSRKAASEPITLNKCLEAFTREEQLGEDERYYCSQCKELQLASKKLQIWRLPPVLIVHLKRFHFLNGRWIKSHKIVDFPNYNLDPTDYLAAVPSKTLQRHRSLINRVKPVSTSSTLVEEEDDDDFNSIMEKMDVGEGEVFNDDDDLDGGEDERPANRSSGEDSGVFSTTERRKHLRTRQESTSLQTYIIRDENLEDFHEHHLQSGRDPLDVRYNLYAMVCHSGVLGGGHYVSYGKAGDDKWFCHNDSSCKQINEDNLDKSTAYMLFYERDGLSNEKYLPEKMKNGSDVDEFARELDEELDSDLKKQCSIM